ncbi:MAG TPA: hypothetical protein VFX06_13140, partial [Stellaceae bacterium]|nr:hypothetical protein [Stellaceae bacterium]
NKRLDTARGRSLEPARLERLAVMIVFSIGLPSRFAEWCDFLLARLIEHDCGSVDIIEIDSVEELGLAAIRASSMNLIARCRQPVPRLQTAILDSGRPFVIALPDPRDALRHLVEQVGWSVPDATRAVASSCSALSRMVHAPKALVLTRDDAREPRATAQAIVRHLWPGVAESRLAAPAEALPTFDSGAEAEDAELWWEELVDRDRAVAHGALRPFLQYFSGSTALEPLVWERELFFISEEPPTDTRVPADRPLDLTGRARILLFGPGINLPPGGWSAKVALGFSQEAAGMGFIVEVYTGSQLAATQLQPSGAQAIEASLHFAIEKTLDRQVEVRILSDRAAFDGRLAIGNVVLTPHPEIQDETQEYLTQVLTQ